jgi:environmental stress-induced protein Ves
MPVIRSAALPVSRWRNGAGRKADIATGDGWMAGFAWLDEEAPFSEFAGQDRTITLLQAPASRWRSRGGRWWWTRLSCPPGSMVGRRRSAAWWHRAGC